MGPLLINGWPNATLSLRNGNYSTTPSLNSTHGSLVIVPMNKTSLWKRWNPHLENSRTSSKKRRSLWKIYKNIHFEIFFSITKQTEIFKLLDIMLALIL